MECPKTWHEWKKATKTSYAKYKNFQLKRQNLTDPVGILVNFFVQYTMCYSSEKSGLHMKNRA